MRVCGIYLALIAWLFITTPFCVCAQTSAFDLAGPPIDARVERLGKTLPISEVPNLEPGDRLWIHADLPESQSARYLLIVAFLRGSTNPPPDHWFTKVETWSASVRQEGVFVTVPKEAQQALVFLAPETAGDFTTLRAAVRGRPGAFVRSVQDLQQASLDRMRLQRYLNAIKSISETDPDQLQQRSALLARSLKIRVDPKCFDLPVEQQAFCLTQNSDQLVLDDAHSQSMVARLANGATADLMNRLSYSQLAGGGLYSAYVGAVVDFARIMGSIHSAQYQYIPALAVPRSDSLSLKLNNPPSFRKPKSVLVVALPPVQKAQGPPLRAVSADQKYCLDNPSLLLPVDGAPLVFATQLAHDMFLHVDAGASHSLELPLETDPAQGGFLVKSRGNYPDLPNEVAGTIHGMWGFDSFEGPKFNLETSHTKSWALAASDKTALIVGREDVLHLSAPHLACVSDVRLRESNNTVKKLAWEVIKSSTLKVKLPLENSSPGPITLEIIQYGSREPDQIHLTSYAEAAEFNHFKLNVGDEHGTLEGKRLDEVATLELAGIHFEPDGLNRRNNEDELRLRAVGRIDQLREAELTARVSLKDGRSFSLPASVLPPRPRLELISKGVQSDDSNASAVHLDNNDLPVNERTVFFVKVLVPSTFPRTEKIEVAASDGSFRALLSIAQGDLMLQDAETAVGILDPEKTFGPSVFGPIRFRPVDATGTTGEWQSLGTLVRLPVLKEIRCPVAPAKGCFLMGDNLFLLSSVSPNPDFSDPVYVPDGFTSQRLDLPHFNGSSVYFKLRDDPMGVQTATLPLLREANSSSASLPSTLDLQKR